MNDIELCTDARAYFQDVVHHALLTRHVEVTGAAEHYVAGLLCDYASGQAPRASDQPLTFQLHDALAARGAHRFTKLQRIGDGVLYLLGFFGEALARRGADPEYVMSVGSSAYGHASAMLRLGGAGGPDVLQELSRKFDRLVSVLRAIADSVLAGSSEHSDGSALKLYERWCATGSEQPAAALAEMGMMPAPGSGGLN